MITPDNTAPARPLSKIAISRGANVVILSTKELNAVDGDVK